MLADESFFCLKPLRAFPLWAASLVWVPFLLQLFVIPLTHFHVNLIINRTSSQCLPSCQLSSSFVIDTVTPPSLLNTNQRHTFVILQPSWYLYSSFRKGQVDCKKLKSRPLTLRPKQVFRSLFSRKFSVHNRWKTFLFFKKDLGTPARTHRKHHIFWISSEFYP